jgi:hypothetical protein
LYEYARRHHYELVVGVGDAKGRPPSWGKVPLLQRLLQHHDFVVWIDADAFILDASVDIATIIPTGAFQAFVVAALSPDKGTAPSMGVWALREGDRAQQFLEQVWQQDDLISHRLWEQAAVMRLIGWTTELPFTKERPSEWDEGTHFLDEEWNMVPQLPIGFAAGRIRHYAGWTNRRRAFEMATDLARMRNRHLRHWIGLLERRLDPLSWPLTGVVRRRTGQLMALARQLRG